MGNTRFAKALRLLAVGALASVLSFALTGCENPASPSYSTSSDYASGAKSAAPVIAENDAHMMSYDSYMGVRTDDVSSAERALIEAVNDVDGRVISADMDLDEDAGTGHANVVCWIPNEKFDDVTNKVRTLGIIYSENIDVTDVTEDELRYPYDLDEPLYNDDADINGDIARPDSNKYNHHYGGGRDISTTSELAVRFVDDDPYVVQLGGLAAVFSGSATGVLYMLAALFPLALVVILIIVIVKAIGKRSANKTHAYGNASGAYSPGQAYPTYQPQASAQPTRPQSPHPQYAPSAWQRAQRAPQQASQPASMPNQAPVPQGEPIIQIQPVTPVSNVSDEIDSIQAR